jgi:uncharacterized protein (TIGR00299 family) protein
MSLRGAHLHLDCGSGIAGDMMLAALIDLGVPVEVVRTAIERLDLDGIDLEISTVRRGALMGKKAALLLRGQEAGGAHGPVRAPSPDPETPHQHVRYASIAERIRARCEQEVMRWALAIFDRLAAVEAARHGVSVGEVAFHELGAADSIADIVGVAAAIAWLEPSGMTCRAVPVGGGTVMTAHGRLPVPAPATLELLRGCVVEAGGSVELTTPTGAAIVRALVETTPGPAVEQRFLAMPTGRVLAIGWGAGTRELLDRPNLLRVVALAPAPGHFACAPARLHTEDEVELLEANLDDLAPNLAAPLIEALLSAGALDAWLTPIVMKKGRPALLVSALAPPAHRAAVEATFFRESTTLGVRRSPRVRSLLDRRLVKVQTEIGPITVKLAGRRLVGPPASALPSPSPSALEAAGEPDEAPLAEVYSATPELEDCRRVAAERGLPLRRVYEIAAAAAASRKTS